MSAEFDRLVAEFDKFQSKLQRVDDQFAGIAQMQEELGALEAKATSPDQSITVIAGPGGTIKDIRVTDAALSQGGAALSGTLMTTLQQAVAASARQQAVLVDQHLGNSLQLTEQVLATQAELLGTDVEELRAAVEQREASTRQRAEEEQHEDYSERELLADPEDKAPPPPPSTARSAGDDFLKNLFDDEEYR
ncbi:YbaB/EbfC family nucleoid-associated protein [Amycolatopsis benzoatilytica]|uniref:YbaB/EbfC family nucleoid-associated protein n=1 Tax=Amycolatopsis benzoatilytica TaxID=346045 RepID=UPI000366F0BA|nr:YbaB/EbfC family nucleoid-associated protein [Amycolatopsis benzoatilytica]